VFLLSVLVVVSLAITHRTLLFVEPWHEHSDYAVDAIQIEKARHFEAIHGNYSRFGFRHPGPGFFYIYALGEQVFYRWLHLVPSPYNAHVLSGLILQCFFFSAGLIIAADWIRRPLFIPLALFTATIHLAFADNAFISTWPPRVLLMPLFCFIISAASVASGQIRHLPLTVLAGCFLVHGHVAQPLYVVPLFVLAYAFAWRRARERSGGIGDWLRAHRCTHLVSFGCIVLFLVPIAIDLAAGPHSNLAQIVEFEASYHGSSKSLWKALVYFAGFFGYVKKPEAFLTVFGPNRATVLGEHLAGYIIWAAIIVVILVNARRMWLRPVAAERPFILALTLFTLLAFFFSLYWGTVQIGPMYEYNGYFFYAILGCMLILLSAAGSASTVQQPRIITETLYIAIVVLTWQRQYVPLAIDYSTNRIPPAVRRALTADPLPAAPKYLLFNRGDWGEAASIALALERASQQFRGDADWGPKFAPDRGFEPAPPDFDLEGLSTWRLSRLGPPDVGKPIRDNLRVYFEPLPLDPTKTVIDCAENGNLELYTLFGFASPLGSAAWTIRRDAGLVCDAPPVDKDLSVTFFAEPFSVAGVSAVQPMTLSVNGRQVFTCTLTSRGSVTARVPAAVWNAKRPVLMVLHLPAAVSPHELGVSLDQRKFGWNLERIVFQSLGLPPAPTDDARETKRTTFKSPEFEQKVAKTTKAVDGI